MGNGLKSPAPVSLLQWQPQHTRGLHLLHADSVWCAYDNLHTWSHFLLSVKKQSQRFALVIISYSVKKQSQRFALAISYSVKKQLTGVEPAPLAWEANVLPIYYSCIFASDLLLVGS